MFFRREANLHILLIAYFYVCIQTYNNLALVCSTAEKIEVLNFFCLQSVPQMSQVVTAFTDSLSKSLTRCHLNRPINEQVASLLLSVVSNNAQAFVGHFAQVVFRGFCRGFVVFFHSVAHYTCTQTSTTGSSTPSTIKVASTLALCCALTPH